MSARFAATLSRTLLGSPVVGKHEHQGVLHLTHRLKEPDQPAELFVCVVEHPCVRGLEPDKCRPAVLVQVSPRLYRPVTVRQRGASRYDAHLDLTFQAPLPDNVITVSESIEILFDVTLMDLMWRVACAKGQVHEEGLHGRDRLLVTDHRDCLVHQVLREVIAVPVMGCGWY
jgi:hypothetical protein